MPTGYTAIIEQGATFEQYVWRCARAMGALIMMRDDSMDAPIPERFEPSDYFHTHVQEMKERVRQLESMNAHERIAEGERLKQSAMLNSQNRLYERNETNRRYEDMRARVEAWTPPTSDHQGFKDFMLEQIRISVDGTEYLTEQLALARAKAPAEFFADELSKVRRTVEYVEQQQREEVERTESRNQWLAALRASVPVPEPSAAR